MTSTEYIGSELAIFKNAVNWKRYLRRHFGPYVAGDVLEVGAGIGGTTNALFDARCSSWTCIEPDASLAAELGVAVGHLRDASGRPPKIIAGALHAIDQAACYDCILYVDTLEHILDDEREVATAASHLRPGGHIALLSPAHSWLYTAFDRAIGHHRRYSRETLERCASPDLEVVLSRYLDSAGIAASLANRLLLRSAMPTPQQLAIWDRLLVPVSTHLDPLLGYQLGKSIFVVMRRPLAQSFGSSPK